MSILTLLVIFGAYGVAPQARPQTPPPWLGVELLSAPGTISGRYDCDGKLVEVDLVTPGFQGSPRLTSLRVGDVQLDPEALAAWNGWLGELAIYESFGLSCREGWVGVNITGHARAAGMDRQSIEVIWRDGEMWRLPQSVEEWDRASRENWFLGRKD